jgi:hypothetical protein
MKLAEGPKPERETAFCSPKRSQRSGNRFAARYELRLSF